MPLPPLTSLLELGPLTWPRVAAGSPPISKGVLGPKRCSNGLWQGAGGLLLSSGPASGFGGTPQTCIRSEMSCPRLRNEGKKYDKSAPLQEAVSKSYGV